MTIRTLEKKLGIDLSVIIVSYNTEDLLGNCLDSLVEHGVERQEIFVVDNDSPDRSVELVKRHYPEVNLIENKKNMGFAAANNQALGECSGKYIIFLNPDTEMPPGSIQEMLSFMEENPSIGLAGARIVNPDRSLQWSVSYKYPGEQYSGGELEGLSGEIACVLGACMVAPRSLLDAMGGFDEDFFLYGEDQDLCLRIRKAGYEIGYVEQAPVVHIGGQSERMTLDYERWRRKVSAERIFFNKHYQQETIRRIDRSNLIVSVWRLLSLILIMPFLIGEKKQEARGKYAKYRALYDSVRNKNKRDGSN